MMGASNLNNVINLMNQNINSMIASSSGDDLSACLQQYPDWVSACLLLIALGPFIGFAGWMVFVVISNIIFSIKEKRNKDDN